MSKSQNSMINKLFTFGEGELNVLNDCIKLQTKKKFPFLSNEKIKKSSIYKKMISQQRSSNQENMKNKINEQKDIVRPRLLSHSEKIPDFTFSGIADNDNRMTNGRKVTFKLKKVSLPKAFRCSLSEHKKNKKDSKKRRNQSSFDIVGDNSESIRYKNSIQNSIMVNPFPSENERRESKKYDITEKPKSLMLLSSMVNQIPQQKMKNIGKTFRRTIKCKSALTREKQPIDNQIVENLKNLRKIYA